MVPEETQEATDSLPVVQTISVTTQLDGPGTVAPAEHPEQCASLAEAASVGLTMRHVEEALVREDNRRTSHDDDAAVTSLDQELGGEVSSAVPLPNPPQHSARSMRVNPPQPHFPLFTDPHDYELEKLRREDETIKKKFEETTLELMAELERKIAEARSEYDKQFHDLDAEYNSKVMEEESKRSFIDTNSVLGNAFTFKCSEYSSAPNSSSARSVQRPSREGVRTTNTATYSMAPPRVSVTPAEAPISFHPSRFTTTQPRPISHRAAVQSNGYAPPPRPSVTAAEAPRPNPSTPIHQQPAVRATTQVNSTAPTRPLATSGEASLPNPSPVSHFPRRTMTQPRPVSTPTTSLPRPSVTAEAHSLPSLRANTPQPRPTLPPPPTISNVTPSSTPPVRGIVVRAMPPHLRTSRPPNSASGAPTTTATATYPRRLVQEPQQQGNNNNSNGGLVYLSDDEE